MDGLQLALLCWDKSGEKWEALLKICKLSSVFLKNLEVILNLGTLHFARTLFRCMSL